MSEQPAKTAGPRTRKIFYSGALQAYRRIIATVEAGMVDIQNKIDLAEEEIKNEVED
ncbi:MAG: hypothetical protein RBR22_13865 [Desulfuromonas sp.]|nr:hypothetical protein [Desulfuromonas sp.]